MSSILPCIAPPNNSPRTLDGLSLRSSFNVWERKTQATDRAGCKVATLFPFPEQPCSMGIYKKADDRSLHMKFVEYQELHRPCKCGHQHALTHTDASSKELECCLILIEYSRTGLCKITRYDMPAKTQHLSALSAPGGLYLRDPVQVPLLKMLEMKSASPLLSLHAKSAKKRFAVEVELSGRNTSQQGCLELAGYITSIQNSIHEVTSRTAWNNHAASANSSLSLDKQHSCAHDINEPLVCRENYPSAETGAPMANTPAGCFLVVGLSKIHGKYCMAGSSSTSNGKPTKTQSASATQGRAQQRSTIGHQQSSQKEAEDHDNGEGSALVHDDHDDRDSTPSIRPFACPFYKYDPLGEVPCQMTKLSKVFCVQRHIEDQHKVDDSCAQQFQEAKSRRLEPAKKWCAFYRALFGNMRERRRSITVDPFWTPPPHCSSLHRLSHADAAAAGRGRRSNLNEHERLLATSAPDYQQNHEHNANIEERPPASILYPDELFHDTRPFFHSPGGYQSVAPSFQGIPASSQSDHQNFYSSAWRPTPNPQHDARFPSYHEYAGHTATIPQTHSQCITHDPTSADDSICKWYRTDFDFHP